MRKPDPHLRTPGPRRPVGRRAIVAAAIVASLVVAGAVTALAGEGEPGSPARVAETAPGPGRLVSAYGLQAVKPVAAFSLADGQEVSVASDETSRCVIRTKEGSLAGEACATTGDAAEGHGISVSDECGTAGQNRMEITGVAPNGTETVRLDFSNATHTTTAVVEGAFKFDGSNPGAGEPYPTGVEWLSSAGTSEGSAPLPVDGDEFCIPNPAE